MAKDPAIEHFTQFTSNTYSPDTNETNKHSVICPFAKSARFKHDPRSKETLLKRIGSGDSSSIGQRFCGHRAMRRPSKAESAAALLPQLHQEIRHDKGPTIEYPNAYESPESW